MFLFASIPSYILTYLGNFSFHLFLKSSTSCNNWPFAFFSFLLPLLLAFSHMLHLPPEKRFISLQSIHILFIPSSVNHTFCNLHCLFHHSSLQLILKMLISFLPPPHTSSLNHSLISLSFIVSPPTRLKPDTSLLHSFTISGNISYSTLSNYHLSTLHIFHASRPFMPIVLTLIQLTHFLHTFYSLYSFLHPYTATPRLILLMDPACSSCANQS